eukprot:Nitzschia sp. Nitz4//scaffold24_size164493//48550//51480//NITZ4_002317-RA/size164493-processed-gene-0.227-mRNA-1//-1//CDS//3329544081//9343//frame0
MWSTGFVALLLLVGSLALESDPQYRVRRRLPAAERELDSTDDFVLTFSDDGKSKVLEPFLLHLFETPEELAEDALPVLRMAMNKFLLEEFNAIYESQHNTLASVGTEVLDVYAVTKNGRRSLSESGTAAEMEVTLTFEREPSPTRSEVEEVGLIVMSDLSHFVTNLTSFQHADWAGVTEAYRLEFSTPVPTAAPVDNTDGVINQPTNGVSSGETEEKNSTVRTVVPTTLVAASLLALLVFLSVQRRSRISVETPKTGPDVMFMGVENDIYSVDRSLESSRSPIGMLSPGIPSMEFSSSADSSQPQDSVFSGVDSPPRTNSLLQPSKSHVSGFTHASATTIRASNKHPQDQAKLRAVSTAGSLFAFDEGPFDEEHYDRDIEGPGAAPSDVSETSDVSPHYQQSRRPDQKSVSSTNVLADLDDLANGRNSISTHDALRMATVEPQTETSTISYNPFNCNPVLPRENNNNERTFKSPPPQAQQSSANNVMATPLIRNTGSTASPSPSANKPGSTKSLGSTQQRDWESGSPGTVGSMSGLATRLIGGAYTADGVRSAANSPRNPRASDSLRRGYRSAPASPDRAQMFNHKLRHVERPSRGTNSKSAPTTPQYAEDAGSWFDMSQPLSKQQVSGSDDRGTGSRSAPSSPKRNFKPNPNKGKWLLRSGRFNGSVSPPSDSEYAEDLSRPSPQDRTAHVSNRTDFGYGCYPFPKSLEASDSPQDPSSSSRRHAGNTGIDGTELYQMTAMEPLDWSYKSADMQSVGGSTISENDGAMLPSQFVFNNSKREARTAAAESQGGEPKTPMSEMSAHTKETNATNASSQGSASRQLINDLVWLERKIADVRQGSVVNRDPPAIDTVDSLSYVSQDNEAMTSASSRDESEGDPTISTGRNDSVMSSIVCRDCFAPPGKLHIVIHSTKDGPAVHTVKEGSSLAGHVYPGDLIISVDNVDTRTYTAEQVMKLMASKSSQERKITVLHFEEG